MAKKVCDKLLYIIGGLACLFAFALIINQFMQFKRLEIYKKYFGDESKATSIYFTTKIGVIEGNIETRTGKKIAVFVGVPFAEPTDGENRFREPKMKKAFSDIYRATEAKPACLQWRPNKINASFQFPENDLLPNFNSVNESENCLYLNIYTPIRSKDTPKTVMVWIHGGSFLRGYTNYDLYDGTMLSTLGDVVVVFVSYRLGVMGFLSGSEEIPGNLGLLDQVLALKWIKNNIDDFGGDPNQVVLFGHGAGAISVGYHLISPLSKNLFKRAIMQSGGPMSLSSLLGSSTGAFKLNKIARKTNCSKFEEKGKKFSLIPTFSNKTIICIRHANALNLMKIQEEMIEEKVDSAFFPVKDGKFLPKHPFDLVNSAQFGNQSEVLIGSNSNNGAVFLLYLLPNIFKNLKKPTTLTMKQIRDEIENYGPKKAKKFYDQLFETISETMNTSNSQILLEEIQRVALDVFFTCPELMFINSYTKAGKNVYYYQFAHKSKNSPWPKWLKGAQHFEEIQYIFGRPLIKSHLYKPSEVKLSSEIMHNWVAFAKNGKPLEPWKPCNETHKSMAVIDDTNIEYLSQLPKSKCKEVYEEFYTVARKVLRHYDD